MTLANDPVLYDGWFVLASAAIALAVVLVLGFLRRP
jgi:hypothetical protein